MGQNRSFILLAALLLALGVCAGEPRLPSGAAGAPLAARRGIEAQLRMGRVPLQILGPASLPAERLADLAGQGVRGLRARFAAQPEPAGPHLVLAFQHAGGSTAACRGEHVPRPAESSVHLLAAYCDGAEAVAEIEGETDAGSDAAIERLVWRATAKLFPDDYADTYGFDLFGLRVRVDGSLSR